MTYLLRCDRYGLLEVMTSLLKCGAEVRGHEEKLAERHCQLFVAEFVSVLRSVPTGTELSRLRLVNSIIKGDNALAAAVLMLEL